MSSGRLPASTFGYKPEFSNIGVRGLQDFEPPENGAAVEDGQVLTYDESADRWRPAGAKNATGTNAQSVPPDATQGADQGYVVGSIWLDKVAKQAFISVDDTPGAAIWARLDIQPLTVPTAVLPTLDTDAASKQYVDQQISGVHWKDPVRVVTTAAVSLNDAEAPANTDGVTLADGERVLVRAQVSGIENGVYLYSTTAAWDRASDLPVGTSASGFAYNVQEGTLYADKAFTCVTDAPADVVGTDPLLFELFTEVIQAGTALEKVNDVMNVKVDGSTVVVDGSNQLTAVAGTYRTSIFYTAGGFSGVNIPGLLGGVEPKFFKVTATGGGGGGGGGETGLFVTNDCGGGGGAGGTAFRYYQYDPSVPTFTYQVGGGGGGGGTNASGSSGAASTFTYNGVSTSGFAGNGGARGDNGGGQSGGGSYSGEWGVFGGNGGAPRNAENLGSHGGGSWWGSGAGMNGNNNSGGQTSNAWGTGGSGGSGDAGGGDGRTGCILIEFAF